MTLLKTSALFAISLLAFGGLAACGTSSLGKPDGGLENPSSSGSGSAGASMPFPGASGGSSGSSSGSSAGTAGGSAGSTLPGMQGGTDSGAADGSAGMPDIDGSDAGAMPDMDEVFNKSLEEYDGSMAGERDSVSTAGGGTAKSAGQRERQDREAVSNGQNTGAGSSGQSSAQGGGMQGTGGMTGSAGQSGSQGTGDSQQSRPGGDNNSESGGTGTAGQTGGVAQGEGERSERDSARVAKIPDDIPADGSNDDIVARQIREAAIEMQEVDPKAAEALWEEYRKRTGIK